MVPQCSMCEIKGRELKVAADTLADCKHACLIKPYCKGIDYGLFNTCYLNYEDPSVVGTKFTPRFKAFRKATCLGDTLPINDHYSLKISLTLLNRYFLLNSDRNLIFNRSNQFISAGR